ncbi:MAG: T9SS type A sorting domain-containing protein [Ignavibacteria bacterium]|jgi:photosystem II stability/assembly factor-like uncharacterized protein|nr:T9SS type A sorting domain-containing protein [Ignavibacteria bacterium]
MKKFTLLILVILFYSYTSIAQWEMVSAGTGHGINKIVFFDENTVFLVGNGILNTVEKTMTKYDFSSQKSSTIQISDEIPSTAQYSSIDILSNKDIIFCSKTEGGTGESQLFISKDNGETWNFLTKFSGETSLAANGLKFFDEELGFAVGLTKTTAKILKTQDGGKNWEVVYDDNDTKSKAPGGNKGNLSSIVFIDKETILVGGSNGLLLRSEDCGKSWSEEYIIDDPLYGMNLFIDEILKMSDNTLIAKGAFAKQLYISKDKGKNWEKINFGEHSSKFLYGGVGSISTTQDNYIYFTTQATGNTSFLLCSKDFGKTWDKIYEDSGLFIDIEINNNLAVIGYFDSDEIIFNRNFKSIKLLTKIQTSLYPNPANSVCTISGFLETLAKDFSISIYDIAGNKLFDIYNDKNLEGEFSVPFNTKQLVSGSYNVIINADGAKKVEKLIIER